MTKKEKNKTLLTIFIVGILFLNLFLFSMLFLSADPTGVTIESITNETKNETVAGFFNISGGYIAALNLTIDSQNTHWKAFVGWVNGKFTLDDMGGATIYDWSLSVTTGRVYSTRYSGTVSWDDINCSNVTYMEAENLAMHHNRTSDNITSTFSDTTHDLFWVAGKSIDANLCPTLNTYNNTGAQDDIFEEMVLYDDVVSNSTIFATILENNETGYDNQGYDFQMLVPENGSQGFSGATAYYLYVELD